MNISVHRPAFPILTAKRAVMHECLFNLYAGQLGSVSLDMKPSSGLWLNFQGEYAARPNHLDKGCNANL